MSEVVNLSLLDGDEGYPERFVVPDELREWSVEYPGYTPPFHEIGIVATGSAEWAEPATKEGFWERPNRSMMFSDDEIPRDAIGRRLNPLSRTGIEGRGKLGKYDVNHVVDPVVLCRDERGQQQILIIEKDDNSFGLPGGFIDKGETPVLAGVREVQEETGLEIPEESMVGVLDATYIHTVRLTDWSWMESVPVYYDLGTVRSTDPSMFPVGGDDAIGAYWLPLDSQGDVLDLIVPDHANIVRRVQDQF